MDNAKFSSTLGAARAWGDERGFSVDTGRVRRQWCIGPDGAATCSLGSSTAAIVWVTERGFASDWSLRGLVGDDEPAELLEIGATKRVDVSYSTDHVEVMAVFRYAQTGFELRYTVWVYPDAPGMRTQVSLKPIRDFERADLPSYLGACMTERLPIGTEGRQLHAVGYYADTQHRNYDHTPIVQSQTWLPENRPEMVQVDWANLLCVEEDGRGVAWVKESHKCVNQAGVDTGAFVLRDGGVAVTGMGLTPVHYGGGFWAAGSGQWRDCWATWTMVYETTGAETLATARQCAVKQMDRSRYPFRPARDRYIMANTWGSGGAGEGSRQAAEQANVLRELGSAADLGIEIVQIDDGWQAAPNEENPTAGDRDWRPSTVRWPDGWRAVKQEAARLGIHLGLWFPYYVATDKIAWNIAEGGFRRVKLDFMQLRGRRDIDEVTAKVQDLTNRAEAPLGINWDATEVDVRMGYYFGREHGNIYLENRENGPPGEAMTRSNHIRYTPRLVLRDAWHLAHYVNLNQIQLSIQNTARVVQDLSNCQRYPHDYCFAITMMGVPLFFQETQYYDEDARALLRPLIARYKTHRDGILAGTVFPIGDEPCDRAWTGFQSHREADHAGYLLVFRELDNSDTTVRLALHFALGRSVSLTDVIHGTTTEHTANADGRVAVTLEEAPGYGFYRYRLH